MKLLYLVAILSLIILFLTIVWSWLVETARAQRATEHASPLRKDLPGLFLAALFALTVSVSPLHAEPHRSTVNLRGDQVLVPIGVPLKDRFVFQRVISLNGQLIAFLYRDPRFQRPVDYAETYNLRGELLEVAWYDPSAGLQIARDINLGNRNAHTPARILKIIHDLTERSQGNH